MWSKLTGRWLKSRKKGEGGRGRGEKEKGSDEKGRGNEGREGEERKGREEEGEKARVGQGRREEEKKGDDHLWTQRAPLPHSRLKEAFGFGEGSFPAALILIQLITI